MRPDDIEAIVFDVYGTLLDVGALAGRCQAVTPDGAGLAAAWRARQLEASFLRTILGDYADFWTVTGEALDAVGARAGLVLDAAAREDLLRAWLDLPPFADVAPALAGLAGRRLAVLSNGTPGMLDAALGRSGLAPAFTAVLSADTVHCFKPAPAVYALAPAALLLPPARMLFCSANGFDVAGAARAGFRVCWVNRAGDPPEPLARQPDLVVSALDELVAWLARPGART